MPQKKLLLERIESARKRIDVAVVTLSKKLKDSQRETFIDKQHIKQELDSIIKALSTLADEGSCKD